MFEQELSALLDIVAYIEDEELREDIEYEITTLITDISKRREREARNDG